MKLVFDPIWEWPLTAIAIVGLFALVLTTYPRRVRHLPLLYRRLLPGLRLAAVLALSFAMLRPAIQLQRTDRNTAKLLILVDESRSMNTPDGPGKTTRRQVAIKLLKDNAERLERLGKDVEILYYNFARELKPTELPGEQADGRQTAIGAVLSELLREAGSQRIAGVLLLSDGAQRALPPNDADPRAAARLLGMQQIHVHTVGIGGTGLSSSSVDLAIENLLMDPIAFEKNEVPIEVKVRALGAAGRDIIVRLLVEDRSGIQPGKSGKMRSPAGSGGRPVVRIPAAKVTQKDQLLSVSLSYIPQRPGEFKIAVVVEPLEGELKTQNNRRETILTVRKGGLRVAYFDKLRPEQHFLLGVNSSSRKIQLDFQPVRSWLKQPTLINPAMFTPGRYDAYIIGDVPASVFGANLLRELASRVEEGAGLLMIGGYHSFGPGGYGRTPLADLLPVMMSPDDERPATTIDPAQHFLAPLKMVPTRLGLQRYVMQLEGSRTRNRKLWESLPALEGANRLEAKKGLVEVWARTPPPQQAPLLLAQQLKVGSARVIAFAGDTTWQWVLADKRAEHHRFWRQMILWICKKEDDTERAVWVRVSPRNFSPGQPVTVEFGARDDAGRSRRDVTFDVRITGPDGKSHRGVPRRGETDSSAGFSETRQPGDYWVRVRATDDNSDSIGFDAWTRFIVDSRDLELDNPAADHALLEEIAVLTGGSTMPPEELGSFLDRMIQQGPTNVGVKELRQITLWDNWPFLVLFVALMSIEWFIRKRRGLV